MSKLQYGAVAVIGGEYKGKNGYYDNDEFDDELNKEVAVVYFGEPFKGPYYLIPHEHLESISGSTELQNFRKKHPATAKVMGV